MLPPMSTLVQPLRDQGVEVINCTPKSAVLTVTPWPYRPLEEVLGTLSEVGPIESIIPNTTATAEATV